MGQEFSRDPPGRYLGYARVIGQTVPSEMLSPVARPWMYRVSKCYVAYDVFIHATDRRRSNALLKGGDALIWNGIASCFAPALMVHWTGRRASMVMKHLKISNPLVPIGVALLLLPLLGPTIDDAVDVIMDNTIRKIMLEKTC